MNITAIPSPQGQLITIEKLKSVSDAPVATFHALRTCHLQSATGIA